MKPQLKGAFTARVQVDEPGHNDATYLMHELKCFSDYISGGRLSYWRSTSGFERVRIALHPLPGSDASSKAPPRSAIRS